MANYTFDETAIRRVLEAAGQQAGSEKAFVAGEAITFADEGHLRMLAECISVEVKDGEVCLDLPLGLGSVCLPVPIPLPAGTAAQACLSICTTWGIPTGVRVTVTVLGNVVVEKTFGKC